MQLLLPLADNAGVAFPPEAYGEVRRELAGRFGGLTVYRRAPAEGLWRAAGEVNRDDMVIYEVMTEALDRAWWSDYRRALEARFRQEELVVRASVIERL